MHKHFNERAIKLFDIMPVVKPFHMNCLKRKDEVVLHRIRIGHTRLTHSYLMEDPNKAQPECFYCDSDLISVKHLLLECSHFINIRKAHFEIERVVVDNLKDLFEKISLKEIILFLKEANLYNLI